MFLGGEPGHRFTGRYLSTRHVSALRKPLAMAGGSILVLAGAVLMLTPGPGLLVMLSGAMLIASESPRAARALDRLELAVRAALLPIRARTVALACGVAAPLVYIAGDIVAARLYPGYSYRDQAVSELFAIGAPTSAVVVVLFSLSSLLYAAFAFGVGSSQHAMGGMIFANAVNALLLWNFFPMHMRGVAPTFTDTMHALLAINPFVVLTIGIALATTRGWFRACSAFTLVIVLVPAALAPMYAGQLVAGEPTPWLGVTERVPQYAHHLWHAVLAIVLARRRAGSPG